MVPALVVTPPVDPEPTPPAASPTADQFGPMKVVKSTDKATKVKPRNKVVDAFFNGGGTSEDLMQEIKTLTARQQDFLLTTRRDLHKCPELMYNEKKTSDYIQKALKKNKIAFTTGWGVNTSPDRIPGDGGYGIVADIGTRKEPCVLLRADMDGLPIMEKTVGIDDFMSTNPGVMHACGNDGHTAMLLAAASILKGMERSIKGTVRLVFQPAAQGGAGAKRMVEEGLLTDDPQPQHAFAMNVNPKVATGIIASRPGTVKAAAERFEITIHGVGGHAAMPHLTVDPIVTASSIVMNLQTLISRSLSPLESGVCSVTKFDAGSAFNVIPASAVLRGTIRALTTEILMDLKGKVEQVVTSTAEMHGCEAGVTYSVDYYPPTVNDEVLYEEFSKEIGAMLSVTGEVVEIEPGMGAEDFGFISEEIPSSYFTIGQGSGTNPPTNVGVHHPHFALDESILPQGVELHVNLALRCLHMLGEVDSDTNCSIPHVIGVK
ncbi:unnamed protein product [Cylindrotheca closterium]|uniref:Peptidase M20 dimerisation domain-containing protein n=1 Tax=Cylindrotheca closterium TaxID=2856 RepID=A0AAD2G6V3_9STRA|nr:unnamed protein product [Cylindrotheca closterium]